MDRKPLKPGPNGLNRNYRNIKNIGFVALIVLVGLIIVAFANQPSGLKEIPLTQAIQQSNNGEYSKVMVNGNELDITKKGGKTPTLKTFTEPNANIKDEGFDSSKIEVVVKPATSGYAAWLSLAGTIIPVVLIAGFL